MNTITIPKQLTTEDLIVIPKSEYERLFKITEMLSLDQVWFWTNEWQKKEKEADDDIASGRTSDSYKTKNELKIALRKLKSGK